jgi:hypothetical protein
VLDSCLSKIDVTVNGRSMEEAAARLVLVIGAAGCCSSEMEMVATNRRMLQSELIYSNRMSLSYHLLHGPNNTQRVCMGLIILNVSDTLSISLYILYHIIFQLIYKKIYYLQFRTSNFTQSSKCRLILAVNPTSTPT